MIIKGVQQRMVWLVSGDSCKPVICMLKQMANNSECPTCHSYFTVNDIILSLPTPILRYLWQYVMNTSNANLKPLHEVHHA